MILANTNVNFIYMNTSENVKPESLLSEED